MIAWIKKVGLFGLALSVLAIPLIAQAQPAEAEAQPAAADAAALSRERRLTAMVSWRL